MLLKEIRRDALQEIRHFQITRLFWRQRLAVFLALDALRSLGYFLREILNETSSHDLLRSNPRPEHFRRRQVAAEATAVVAHLVGVDRACPSLIVRIVRIRQVRHVQIERR